MPHSLRDESRVPELPPQTPERFRVITTDPATRTRVREQRIAVHAGRTGAGILVSRLIGLAREQTIAGLFGAGLATDAFNVAFRIPNLLRDLFTEGALPSLFVPVFTDQRKQGEEASLAFARQLMITLFILSLFLCALGYVFAPAICGLLAPGFASVPGKLELTITLMRVMLPLVPSVTIAAVASGVLNARSKFVIPALTPGMLSVGVIGGTLLLVPIFQGWEKPPIVALSLSVVLGGILMVAFQLPALHALGFRFRLEAPRLHPGVLRLGSLMLPATIGLAATNLHLFASTFFASLMQQGSVSWLWYAYRVVQLPAGVIGAALAIVSLTSLSQAAKDQDMDSLKTTLSATLRLMFALTVPASLWMALMAGPVTLLLYQYGAFLASDSVHTANALRMYCVGLPAIAACGVLTRTFYALGDSATPVRATLLSGALGLGLNLLCVGPLRPLGIGHVGLALSTSLAMIANLFILRALLVRKIGGIGGRDLLKVVLRSVVASALALLPSVALLFAFGNAPGRWGSLLILGGSLVSTVFLGWWAMRFLKAEELPVITDALRYRVRRKSAA